MNVVLCVIDTLRRDHLGCYGNDWIRTPNFDRLAQMGTTFDNAYLSSSPCMPARREIMTGRHEWPWRGWGPLEPTDPCLFQLTREQRSMLITDHYHLFEHGAGNYHWGATGYEFIRGQENDAWITDPGIDIHWPAPERTKCHFRWQTYFRNTAQWRHGAGWQSEDHTFAAQVFGAAANWVDRHAADDNWLLTIDCFDPHEPFDPPAPYDTMYTDNPPPERIRWPIYGTSDRYTDEELADIRALYAGKVTLVDTWFGHFLDRLERHGLLDNTLLLVTTDHGHLFGEHSMIGKPGTLHGDSNLYQEMAHIPLWVAHPDLPGGQRCGALTQPVDYLPTILDTYGIERPAALHGDSLLPLMQDSHASIRDVVCYAKYGEGVGINDGRHVLFQWPPAETNEPLYWYSATPPQFLKPRGVGDLDRANLRYPIDHLRGSNTCSLFDLASDPKQEHDILADEPGVAESLRRQMTSWLDRIGAPGEVTERLQIGS